MRMNCKMDLFLLKKEAFFPVFRADVIITQNVYETIREILISI